MATDIEFSIPNTEEFHNALGVLASINAPNSPVPNHLVKELGMTFGAVLEAEKVDCKDLEEEHKDLTHDILAAYCSGVQDHTFNKVVREYCERNNVEQMPEDVVDVLKEAHKKGFYYLVGRVSRLMSMHQPWYIADLAH